MGRTAQPCVIMVCEALPASETGGEFPRGVKHMRMTCPICKKTTTWNENPFRPFCSERCKLMDLGKWAAEDYRIAGDKKTPDTDADEQKKN